MMAVLCIDAGCFGFLLVQMQSSVALYREGLRCATKLTIVSVKFEVMTFLAYFKHPGITNKMAILSLNLVQISCLIYFI